MDFRDIQNLSEAYLGIYEDLNEANKIETHLGLNAKEKKEARNKRNNPFKSEYGEVHRPSDEVSRVRSYRHKSARGISPKKRRADIEKQIQYDKKSEKNIENSLQSPSPEYGRKSSLGLNYIRRTQPYLKFARTRLQRKDELKGQEEKRMQDDGERRRRPQPTNKIVPFHREDIEYLMNYLIGEGYATSLESAENIALHMSEEWAYNILNEGSIYDMFKAHNDELGASIQRDNERAARIKTLSDKAAQFAAPDIRKQSPSSGPKRTRQQIISDIKKKLDDAEEVMRRQDKTK